MVLFPVIIRRTEYSWSIWDISVKLLIVIKSYYGDYGRIINKSEISGMNIG